MIGTIIKICLLFIIMIDNYLNVAHPISVFLIVIFIIVT